EPSIRVENTYDPDAVGNDSRYVAPDITITGDVLNSLGTATIRSEAGSVVVDGDVRAKTVKLSAGRDFVLGYKEGFRHIGSDLKGLWDDWTCKLETGKYVIKGDNIGYYGW